MWKNIKISTADEDWADKYEELSEASDNHLQAIGRHLSKLREIGVPQEHLDSLKDSVLGAVGASSTLATHIAQGTHGGWDEVSKRDND